MTKKLLILLSLFFCILFVSTVCFATVDINTVGNTVRDGVKATENAIGNTAGGISNGVTQMGNDASSITDTNRTDGGQTTTDYTATRTATDGGTDATGFMGSTAWTWVILAIVAIIIIALVWYYANQNTNTRNDQ
jgi:hypothetical protein